MQLASANQQTFSRGYITLRFLYLDLPESDCEDQYISVGEPGSGYCDPETDPGDMNAELKLPRDEGTTSCILVSSSCLM